MADGEFLKCFFQGYDVFWGRTRLDGELDVFFHTDVNGDDFCDLVDTSGTSLVRAEANHPAGAGWTARRVAGLPDDRTQG